MKNETTIRADTTKRHLLKYRNRNPIHQFALDRFFDVIAYELRNYSHSRVLEFGCGEGLFLEKLKQRGITFKDFTGIDLREDALEYARDLHPKHQFLKKDLMNWECPEGSFDIVIASQVLEHLPEPKKFLERLVYLSRDSLLLTVPWEPWFRLINFLRGRDILRFGNHPEHVNHWGIKRFKQFVSKYAKIKKNYTVFPFIVLIAHV